MIPPIFTRIKNDASVTALLGTNPVRFYLSSYPQGVDIVLPYAVYAVVAGTPSSYLSEAPLIDNSRVQIDVYGETATEADGAYKAIRNSLEPVAKIVSFNFGGQFDLESKTYRYGFDISYWNERG
jgi:hypothetical protein